MGDADVVEEIIAEPEDPGFLQAAFLFVHSFVAANGWYILAAGASAYYLWRNKIGPAIASARNSNQSPEELESWQAKEEKRLKAIQRLQEKYQKDAEIKAEKQKILDEQKKKARMAELEELTKNSGGEKLGSGSSKASFKPEYNPLMGDAGSSNRVCFRRPGGGSGG